MRLVAIATLAMMLATSTGCSINEQDVGTFFPRPDSRHGTRGTAADDQNVRCVVYGSVVHGHFLRQEQ